MSEFFESYLGKVDVLELILPCRNFLKAVCVVTNFFEGHLGQLALLKTNLDLGVLLKTYLSDVETF